MNGDPRRGDDRQPDTAESRLIGEAQDRAIGSSRWLRRWLRILVLTLAVCATAIILYGMVQLFICDFREIAFPGLPRRARWLCP